MAVILDTTRIPPEDRAATIDSAFAEATVPHSVIHEPSPEGINARLDYWAVGKAAVFRHESSGIRHTRTPRQLRLAAPERVAMIVHQGGPGIYQQADHELRLRNGHLYVADLTMAYTLFRSGQGAATVFQVDHRQLGLPVETIRGAVARLPASPLYDLLRGYLPQFFAQLGSLAGGMPLTSAVSATIELTRALIATASDDGRFEPQAMADTLRMRVVSYISQHLTDSDLSPQQIASENNISVRHLHSMWRDSSLSLTQWIIAQRLEGARDELAQARSQKNIAAICHAWGFTDVTHFGRRFRAAYGMSPREWRQLCREAGAGLSTEGKEPCPQSREGLISEI